VCQVNAYKHTTRDAALAWLPPTAAVPMNAGKLYSALLATGESRKVEAPGKKARAGFFWGGGKPGFD